jgi:hypothetical protein
VSDRSILPQKRRVLKIPLDFERTFTSELGSICIIRYSSFVIRHSLFVIRYSSLVIRYSLFVIGYSLFVIGYWGEEKTRLSRLALPAALFTQNPKPKTQNSKLKTQNHLPPRP